MNELFALLSFAVGIPLLIIGYIMGIIAVKHMELSWRIGMVLAFPFAMPLLALIHWQRAKKPFIYSTVGILLILYTLINIPD
jgi:hypothetical protein